jgi:predicted GH43/DUF377 family glycosyl hydrolase
VVRKKQLNKANLEYLDIYNIYYASFSGNQSPAVVAASLEESSLIEYTEPKYIHYLAAIPNDTLYHKQESYFNIIKASQAWDVVKGEDGKAIIAIVDGGTNIRHPDLADNIWTNETEVNGIESVDDDGNGYIDDLYGWNFANESGDPTGLKDTPVNANHGTRNAGIVSAISDNLIGVAGVSWNATVMSINVSSETNDGSIAHGIDGIIYAVENGADVINCSWGGYDIYSRYEQDIIKHADSLGVVVIAAAGNDNTDQPFYPASYDNVLSIAGTDTNDNKWSGSNYGPNIDLAAPAESIYGPVSKESYGTAVGTSLSAPLVAGVAGLVKAQNPNWTGKQAGEQVRITADPIPAHAGELGRGRLNAFRAVTEISPSIHFVDYEYVDENDNRFIEAGERIELKITLINYLAIATDVNLILSSSSDYVTFVNDEVTLSSIGTLERKTLSEPFVFDVAENISGNPLINFDLQITTGDYNDQDRFTFEQVFKEIEWIKYNDQETTDPPIAKSDPVLKPGPAGDWDESFVGVQSVLYDSLTDLYKMWFQGGTGPYTGSIGYATSPDGIHWTKYDDPATTDPPFSASDPVLKPGSAGDWDSLVVGMSSVVMQDNAYHMWYTGLSDSLHFNIGYATSPDGIKWSKYQDNPVLKIGPKGSWDETWIFFPSVIFDGSIFKMWYTGSQGDPVTYENWQNRIGYATSPDGIIWTKYDNPGTVDSPFSISDPVLEPQRSMTGEFDYWSVISPFILFDGSKYQMWYAGFNNPEMNIGVARSLNGITWYRGDNNPILEVSLNGEWDYPIVQNPKVIQKDGIYHIWYGAGKLFEWQIGYARSEDFPVGIDDHNIVDIPQHYILSKNYPNPFNPTTIINYELPTTNHVDLSIYNTLGQEVATIVSERQNAGTYQVQLDASDLASGVYYYQLVAGDYREVKKMILLR